MFPDDTIILSLILLLQLNDFDTVQVCHPNWQLLPPPPDQTDDQTTDQPTGLVQFKRQLCGGFKNGILGKLSSHLNPSLLIVL